MIPPDALILLDTNVLIHLVRGNELGRRIDADHQLLGRADRPIISVVTIGETLSLARQFNWGQAKAEKLRELLREFPVVDINSEPVLTLYAELDHFSRSNGRRMGKNDVWIAACAVATDAWLLTCDQDFDVLADAGRVRREWVDPTW